MSPLEMQVPWVLGDHDVTLHGLVYLDPGHSEVESLRAVDDDTGRELDIPADREGAARDQLVIAAQEMCWRTGDREDFADEYQRDMEREAREEG